MDIGSGIAVGSAMVGGVAVALKLLRNSDNSRTSKDVGNSKYVPREVCDVHVTSMLRQMDEAKTALNEGFKNIYEKLDRLNDKVSVSK